MNEEIQRNLTAREQNLLSVLGECLEYPTAALSAHVKKAVDRLGLSGEVRRLLGQFNAFMEGASPEKVEDVYTNTFDLEPATCPYVGYHLFGDTYRRGIFMAKLAEYYRACGIERGQELPDHLTVVLRFLCRAPDAPDAAELIESCIIPALRVMARAFTRQNPYLPVIQALRITLERERGKVHR